MRSESYPELMSTHKSIYMIDTIPNRFTAIIEEIKVVKTKQQCQFLFQFFCCGDFKNFRAELL